MAAYIMVRGFHALYLVKVLSTVIKLVESDYGTGGRNAVYKLIWYFW
jgi:hypothetical protein